MRFKFRQAEAFSRYIFGLCSNGEKVFPNEGSETLETICGRINMRVTFSTDTAVIAKKIKPEVFAGAVYPSYAIEGIDDLGEVVSKQEIDELNAHLASIRFSKIYPDMKFRPMLIRKDKKR